MEDFFVCALFFGVILGLIFIVSTLSRLRSQEDLIKGLRKEFLELKNEFYREKEENTEVKSAMRERFDEVKEAAAQAVVKGAEEDKPVDTLAEEEDKAPEPVEEKGEGTEIQLQPAADKKPEARAAVVPPPLPVNTAQAAFAKEPSPDLLEKSGMEAVSPPPVPSTEPGKLKQLLERIYLWPPSGDTAAEATIVGWWATRLGLVVGIIAATFTGIHVAESVPAWLRVSGLGALAIALVGAGVWLEKKIPAFGRLISAGGLGLAYFTAFAAFALKPMQIIESPVVALLVQAATVGVMVGWSLWRRDELVAGMATVLGYVSCWFSLQNDQLNFVIVGLLLLGAAGSFMLWRRKWLWPQGFAIAGTWGGFLVLSVFEWTQADAPPFAMIVACFAVAALIFEVGHFFTGPNLAAGSEPAKWLRRFSVASSSLAILVGFYVFTLDYPNLKSGFYLAFTGLMLAFSLAHYFRKHEISRGIDQMFFLKASALLCLFFVAEFDGPIRWMSIALQTGAMLWAWKRTRYTWVEVGFAVLFFVTLGTMARGIFNGDDPQWFAFGVRNIVGMLALVALSLWTALHREWRFPNPDEQPGLKSPFNPIYVVGSVGIGLTAWFLANFPAGNYTDKWRSIVLLVAGILIAAPLLRWAKAGPFIAATTALFAGFLKVLVTSGRWQDEETSSICMLAFAIAVVVAELCRRFWPEHWKFGNAARTLYAGFGVVLFYQAGQSIVKQFAVADDLAVPLCVIAFAGIGALLLWQNSRPLPTETEPKMTAWPWLLAVLIGVLVSALGIYPRDITFSSVWLTVGAAMLFASAFLLRNGVPALAGGIPLVIGTFNYLGQFGRDSDLGDHTVAALAIFALTLAVAIVLYRKTREQTQGVYKTFEAILLGIGLLVIHWLLRNSFDASSVFVLDCGIGLAALILSRRWSMRALKFCSALPLLFGILHVAIMEFGFYRSGGDIGWWVAAVLVAVWVWLYNQGEKIRRPDFFGECPDGKITFGWPTGIATAAFWLIAFHGAREPWLPVAFAGFAILVLTLWRYARIESGHVWTWLLLASAVVSSVVAIASDFENETATFASVMLATALIGLHGLFYSRREPQFRNLVIFHSIPALGLAFWASSPGVLIIDELTTVLWGVASITLFVLGFVFGLRIYRIVGLVGIGLSLARVFIVDIEDTLYRIFASFAVTIVLLAVGFLYIKFRNRIENGPFSDKTSE